MNADDSPSSTRAAERCGRRAAELVDDGDGLLLCGASPALAWAVSAAAGRFAGLRLYAPAAAPPSEAPAGGLPVVRLDAAALAALLASDEVALCLLATGGATPDGAVVVAPGVRDVVEQLRARRVPVYALVPGGPQPAGDAADLLPPSLVSAIVTERGIYRPERIERHHDDADVPPDIIPLG